MNRSLRLARLIFATLVGTAFFISSASAQTPMPKKIMGFKGKFAQAVPPDGIAVTDPTKNNALALVKITPGTKLNVEGTADPSFLGPGVSIEFSAEMTRLGVVQSPLDSLTVCELDQVAPATFQPAEAGQTLPKEKDAVVKMQVRGTILSNKNGNLLVRTPGAMVKAKLADDPKIKVLVHNYAWALPGDSVTLDGLQISAAQPDQPEQIQGTVVQIAMSKMLEGKKKPVPRKRPGRS
jgi:hypothetical protein